MKVVVTIHSLLSKAKITQQKINVEIEHWLQMMMHFVVITDGKLCKIFIEAASSLKNHIKSSQQMVLYKIHCTGYY